MCDMTPSRYFILHIQMDTATSFGVIDTGFFAARQLSQYGRFLVT